MLANVAAGDDFDASNLVISYVVDANGDGVNNDGAAVVYNGTSTPDIEPDQIVFVTIEGDIPAASQGETSDLTLLAETAITGGSGTLVTEDTDGNDNAAVENVFADAAGDVTGDDAEDGSHSATNTYTVSTADITAEKLVNMRFQALVWNTQLQRQIRAQLQRTLSTSPIRCQMT